MMCEVSRIRVMECCHITLGLGGKFWHMLTGGCCWNNYTKYFFFLNEHAPPQVTLAPLDSTFMFC